MHSPPLPPAAYEFVHSLPLPVLHLWLGNPPPPPPFLLLLQFPDFRTIQVKSGKVSRAARSVTHAAHPATATLPQHHRGDRLLFCLTLLCARSCQCCSAVQSTGDVCLPTCTLPPGFTPLHCRPTSARPCCPRTAARSSSRAVCRSAAPAKQRSGCCGARPAENSCCCCCWAASGPQRQA